MTKNRQSGIGGVALTGGSKKSRRSVEKVSTKCRKSLDEVSKKCRQSVEKSSTKCRTVSKSVGKCRKVSKGVEKGRKVSKSVKKASKKRQTLPQTVRDPVSQTETFGGLLFGHFLKFHFWHNRALQPFRHQATASK